MPQIEQLGGERVWGEGDGVGWGGVGGGLVCPVRRDTCVRI